MKKFLALLLSLLILLAFAAGCSSEAAPTEPLDHSHETETPPAVTQELHDHNHINYKGLNSSAYTLEDLIAAEGAEPAFTFDAKGITYYVYNNVTVDNLSFTQVQHSFTENYNRVSCTSSGNQDPESVLAQWDSAMTELYGAPLASDNGTLRWTEHTGNYVTLTQLNEDTVQLCFYFTA